MRRYTRSHEWVEATPEPGVVRVGVTRAFSGLLRPPLLRVELPGPGARVRVGVACGTVVAERGTSAVYAPATGTVRATNPRLAGAIEPLAAEPEGAGWLFELRCERPDELELLCDEVEYLRFADDQDVSARSPS